MTNLYETRLWKLLAGHAANILPEKLNDLKSIHADVEILYASKVSGAAREVSLALDHMEMAIRDIGSFEPSDGPAKLMYATSNFLLRVPTILPRSLVLVNEVYELGLPRDSCTIASVAQNSQVPAAIRTKAENLSDTLAKVRKASGFTATVTFTARHKYWLFLSEWERGYHFPDSVPDGLLRESEERAIEIASDLQTTSSSMLATMTEQLAGLCDIVSDELEKRLKMQ